jgi:hypothetical protein
MSLALDEVIRRHGGDIWYNSEVTKVIMKDSKPAGVVINGDKEVYGKYFICNSSPNIVWNDLFEQKDIPEKQLKMLNSRKIACALTTVYLGMNKTKEELGITDYSVFIAPDSDSDKQYEAAQNYFSGYCIINCLNEIIPDCTPEGTSQLFLTTMTFGDVMKDIEANLKHLISKLKDTLIVITADHGMIDAEMIVLNDYPDICDCFIRPPSIEARTTTLAIKEIRKVEFVKLFNKYFGNDFKLFTKQEFISSGLLGGGTPHRKVDDFIADFVAVSTSHKSLHYTTGQKELPQLKGDHAGISEYEMKIPLIFIEN